MEGFYVFNRGGSLYGRVMETKLDHGNLVLVVHRGNGQVTLLPGNDSSRVYVNPHDVVAVDPGTVENLRQEIKHRLRSHDENTHIEAQGMRMALDALGIPG